MNRSVDEIIDALENCWDEETSQCGEGVWSKDNPARGQCAVTAVIVQDFLGGELIRGVVESELLEPCSHYWNELPNGMWLDLTQSQFQLTSYTIREIDSRTNNYVLKNVDTLKRYKLLKSRVVNYLATKDYDREQRIKELLGQEAE